MAVSPKEQSAPSNVIEVKLFGRKPVEPLVGVGRMSVLKALRNLQTIVTVHELPMTESQLESLQALEAWAMDAEVPAFPQEVWLPPMPTEENGYRSLGFVSGLKAAARGVDKLNAEMMKQPRYTFEFFEPALRELNDWTTPALAAQMGIAPPEAQFRLSL